MARLLLSLGILFIIVPINGEIPSFLHPEMDHSVIESSVFLWITRTLDIILSILLMIFIVTHVIKSKNNNDNRMNKHNRRSSSQLNLNNSLFLEKWTSIMNKQIWLYLILSFIFMFLMTVNIWSLFIDKLSCKIVSNIMVGMYHFNKGLYYYILITRLHISFGLSVYNYHKYLIYSLFIFVLVYTIFIIFGSYFSMYGVLLNNPVIWCHIHIHTYDAITIGVLSWIIIDLIISITLMILFIKPLKRLLKDMSSSKQKKFRDILTKSVILTTITNIISISSLLLYLLKHLTILIEISIPIQCLCFLLMQSIYDELYYKLCGICHKVIQRESSTNETSNNKTETTLTVQTTKQVSMNAVKYNDSSVIRHVAIKTTSIDIDVNELEKDSFVDNNE